MKNLIVRWLIGVVAVWLTVQLGVMLGVGLGWKGFWGAVVFVLALALVNAFIRPMIRAFTLPLTCLTFGLFTFVVNALLFLGTAHFTNGIKVSGFWAALFGSVVLSLLSSIINGFVRRQARHDEQ